MQYNVGGDYFIRFETPDFTNLPQVFTVYLHYEKCCPWYEENEPLQITIVNTPPVLDGTLASEITIYDGLTGSLNYHASDPENSNLLEIRFSGTLPPPWITLTPAGHFEGSPEIMQNDVLYVTIEAFDGALVSTPWTIKVIVIYDPPVATDTLVDQKDE